jgi:hypothetical protein
VSRPDSPSAAAGARSGATAAVSPPFADAPGLGPVTERIAQAVLAHPDVAALSSGPYGSVTTYLPGRRVAGIALGEGDEPARVSVVLRYGAPIQATAAALRQLVAGQTGARRVDVVITDLALPGEPTTDVPPADAAAGRSRP